MQIEGKGLEILSAAKAISRFRACRSLPGPAGDIFGVYDTLLDVIGDPNAAWKISGLLNASETGIRSDAQEMIDLLLFNSESNPYMSLGLPEYSPAAVVNRRWKRLIVLYHPDKYSNRPGYEERAKRINEAYENIHSTNGHCILPEPAGAARKAKVGRRGGFKRRIRRFRYLKRLPDFILAAVIVMAIISAVLFISYLTHPPVHPREEEQVSSPRQKEDAAGIRTVGTLLH